MSRRFALAALALALMCACGGEGTPAPAPSSPTPEPGCRVLYAPPEGFLPTHTIRLPESRGGGVRASYADAHGDTLHLTSGIEGEFGEGGAPAGSFDVSTGQRAHLVGRRRSWVLRWELPGPCRTQTVGANGFERGAFVALVRRMGVVVGAGR
jgi:hypothetical protein